MSLQISWVTDKKVLLIDIDGSMTIEELGQMSNEIEAFLDEGHAPVHIIFDLRDVTPKLVKLNELSQATKFLRHPALGLHAMVSSNRLINFFGTVVHNMVGSHQAYVTENLEDAIERFKRLDAARSS